MLQQKVVQIKSRTWAAHIYTTHTFTKREREKKMRQQAERPLSNILFRNYVQSRREKKKKSR